MPHLGFPGDSAGRDSPTAQEPRVRSLSQEDPLEEHIATHSRILAWRVSMGREAWQTPVYGVRKSPTWLSDWTELNWSQLPSWWQRINLEDLIAYLEMVLTLAICMAIQSKLVGQNFRIWGFICARDLLPEFLTETRSLATSSLS